MGEMRRKIIISVAVAFVVGGLAGPPDMISQAILALGAALLCGVPLLILTRLDSVRSSPRLIHTLLCVLICLLSLSVIACYLLGLRVSSLQERMYDLETAPIVETQTD